ncbi:MAG: T9SS type A sorting domain-containing protein, partial [Bacteroidales bacterium]|nr:T9SS type A sorting domain-containing protein [Bacteroidales bacterium]
QGTVVTSVGQTITDGYVLAFLLSDGVISTQVDSVAIQEDGSYVFENMASCVDYIFHAYSNADMYPFIIPRWYTEAFYWYDATPITVAWEDDLVEGIDISLFEVVPPPPGSSEMGGGVYYYGKGEPVKNIDVVLEFESPDDKADVIVGYKPTDELGQWTFGELPEGVFKVRVDIPGLQMDSVYTIEITQPNTVITGLNYYLDPDNGIFIDFTGVDELDPLSFGTISIFPNPNNGQFYLEINKSDHIASLDIQSVELWDMEGRRVKDLHIHFKGDRYISSFNMNDIQPGLYFIKVRNNDAVGVKKFVIQR